MSAAGAVDGQALPAVPEHGDARQRRERLVELYREASGCHRCPLAATRTKVVFGAGNADAELMFVGEAPGADEDRRGLPFVGRAGGLLSSLLAEQGLERDDVWITNVLKCRPPGNRDPQPLEIERCRPYLERQIELIAPRAIATLGNFATKLLTGNREGITRVHGVRQLHELGGRPVWVLPLYHPAAALRTPRLTDALRTDMSTLTSLLATPPPPLEPAGPVTGGSAEPQRAAAGAAHHPGLGPDPSAGGDPEPPQLDLF